MKAVDFHYDLSADRIAQEPVTPRDHSRLMVIPQTGILHRHFYDLPEFLHPNDVLVLNTTRVFPARLRGKKPSGGKVEVLLMNAVDPTAWRVLVRGAMTPTELHFPEGLTGRMEQRLENGEWTLRFSRNSLRSYLDQHGEMPLPPYIKRSQRKPADTERYQTVYAREEGAVAAPTAGFHFTPELLKTLRDKGVEIVEIVLHVGWGTFRPVRTETIEDHVMLPESYEISAEAARALTKAKQHGRRIVAVGTTVTRTLESIVEEGAFRSGSGSTDLFIYPGYTFKAVDALITNFHLPDSTPLLLACAFFSDTPFSLKSAYQAALQEGYRFYSYGDAMLIL